MTMPASYAHYRFGKQLLPELPADIRQNIQRFRRMYDMGLHGPDIFFYYNPFVKNSVFQLGKTYHCQSGQEFFTRACVAADSEAGLAYLYGLLAHYCLDSLCHPYVHKTVEAGEARHVAMEAEFERYLLQRDGELPLDGQRFAKHVKLTRGECMTVSRFYPPATGANVSIAVRFMAFSLRFLNGKNRVRTEKILSRLPQSIQDQLIPEDTQPGCAMMNSELLARYNRAVKLYPQLLGQLRHHMKTGEPLGEDFTAVFG